MKLDIENQDQAYHVVKGLLDRREFEEEHGTGSTVEGIDELLDQFEGHAVEKIIVLDQ